MVTFDALHTVRANLDWLTGQKKAHYIAVVKKNQPLLYARLKANTPEPWREPATLKALNPVIEAQRTSDVAPWRHRCRACYAVLTTAVDVGLMLDRKDGPHVVRSGQAACGGLAWTSQASSAR